MVKCDEIESYEKQVRYDLSVNGKHVTTHIVDFLVTTKDGKTEVHEYKGFATSEWGIKMRLFEALYPTIPYIVIKHIPTIGRSR